MRCGSQQGEAYAIWSQLLPMIQECVKNQTKDCIRQKKLTVVIPPDGQTIGVMQPNDPTVFQIPYVSSLSDVTIGTMVLAQYFYGMSNMIAVSLADGQTGDSGGGGGTGIIMITVLLSSTGWTGAQSPYTQTVVANGVTSDNPVLVSPNVSQNLVAQSFGVSALSQGNGTLTFSCVTIPNIDIEYNVGILSGGNQTSFVLSSSNWSGSTAPYTQTVSVSGVTETNGVLVSPSPSSSNAAGSSSVSCISQSSGSLSFQALTIPSENLTYNAYIFD